MTDSRERIDPRYDPRYQRGYVGSEADATPHADAPTPTSPVVAPVPVTRDSARAGRVPPGPGRARAAAGAGAAGHRSTHRGEPRSVDRPRSARRRAGRCRRCRRRRGSWRRHAPAPAPPTRRRCRCCRRRRTGRPQVRPARACLAHRRLAVLGGDPRGRDLVGLDGGHRPPLLHRLRRSRFRRVHVPAVERAAVDGHDRCSRRGRGDHVRGDAPARGIRRSCRRPAGVGVPSHPRRLRTRRHRHRRTHRDTLARWAHRRRSRGDVDRRQARARISSRPSPSRGSARSVSVRSPERRSLRSSDSYCSASNRRGRCDPREAPADALRLQRATRTRSDAGATTNFAWMT